MLRVPVYNGVLKLRTSTRKGCAGRLRKPERAFLMGRPFLVAFVDVEGSILVMVMARRVGFATVTSELVSIRFRLSVRQLRGLCWTSIVCGILSF